MNEPHDWPLACPACRASLGPLSSLGSEAVSQQKPVLHDTETGADGLAELAAEIRSGAVDTLVVTAANPLHTAPYELNLATALDAVPNSIYRGLYQDETAQRCAWFIPATHPLEEWGDARAHDGTVTFLQTYEPAHTPLTVESDKTAASNVRAAG